MSKSFKRQRQYDDYEYEEDRKERDKLRNRRDEKRIKNDLKTWRNVSLSDIKFVEDDER